MNEFQSNGLNLIDLNGGNRGIWYCRGDVRVCTIGRAWYRPRRPPYHAVIRPCQQVTISSNHFLCYLSSNYHSFSSISFIYWNWLFYFFLSFLLIILFLFIIMHLIFINAIHHQIIIHSVLSHSFIYIF